MIHQTQKMDADFAEDRCQLIKTVVSDAMLKWGWVFHQVLPSHFKTSANNGQLLAWPVR